jgi:hypothetical protein
MAIALMIGVELRFNLPEAAAVIVYGPIEWGGLCSMFSQDKIKFQQLFQIVNAADGGPVANGSKQRRIQGRGMLTIHTQLR